MKYEFNILRNDEPDNSGGGGGGSGGDTPSPTPSGGSLLGGGEPAPPPTPPPNNPQPPTPGGSAFDFRSLVDDQGNFLTGFGEKLPEDLKGLEKFRSPKQLLEGYSNLQQLLGKKADAVVIPAADAPKEQWAPVLRKLGVPDSPDGYGLKVPDSLPDGVKVDPAEVGEFSKFAHEIGLTPQQAASLQAFDIERAGKNVAGSVAAQQAEQEASFKAQADALNNAWGTGNARIQNAALAERAALTFGFAPEEISGEKADPLFANAKFVMALARAGKLMSEDSLVKGSDVNSSGSLKARAMDVINNPQNPMYQKYWAGDEDVASQVRGWMKAG